MQTVKQVRSLEEARKRQELARKTAQQNWTRVLDSIPDADLSESECNAPRIPHAWDNWG